MNKPPLTKIPTTFMPEDWAETEAENFKCSKSRVEKVVYGIAPNTPGNKKIWEHMLSVAESGKAAEEAKQRDHSTRIAALHQ